MQIEAVMTTPNSDVTIGAWNATNCATTLRQRNLGSSHTKIVVRVLIINTISNTFCCY
jgi:hypothetical protein